MDMGLALRLTRGRGSGGSGPVAQSATFGEFTAVGAGAVATSEADGVYGEFTVTSGFLAANTSPLTVGTATVGATVVTVEAGRADVASTTELEAAHNAAPIGATRTLNVRQGDYSASGRVDLETSAKRFTGRITIQGEGIQQSQLPGIDLEGNDNITLSNLDVQEDYTALRPGVVHYGNTNNIIIEDCYIHGTDFDTITFSDLGDPTKAIGVYQISTTAPTNAIIRRNHFRHVDYAVEMDGGASCVGNLLTDIGSKSFQLQGDPSGFEIIDNYCHGFFTYGGTLGTVGPNNPTGNGSIWPFDQGTEHSALIGYNVTTAPTSGVIRGNVFLMGDNRWNSQGDYHGSSPRSGPFDQALLTSNITIENNVFEMTGTVFDFQSVAGLMRHNTIFLDKRHLRRQLDYDGGTSDFTIGALLTASSGGTYRICDISGTTASGTIDVIGVGTINDNDTLTDGSGGAAVANGVIYGGIDNTGIRIEDAGDVEVKHNIGQPYLANAGEYASSNSAIFTKAWNNPYYNQDDETGNALAFFDVEPTDVDLDDFQTKLAPKVGGLARQTNAPIAGAINTYWTWATGVGTTSYSAGSGTFPSDAKPATSLVNGTAITDQAEFDGSTSYIAAPASPLSGFGGDEITFAFRITPTTGWDGTNGAIFDASNEKLRIEKRTDNHLLIKLKDSSNVTFMQFITASPIVEADGITNYVISWKNDGRLHVLRNGNLEGTHGVGLTNEFQNGILFDTGVAAMRIGSDVDGTDFLPFILDYFWIGDEFVDMFAASELDNWIGQDDVPAALGADGSTPTGTQPAHFLAGSGSAMATNAGTGSNWTANAITAPSTTYTPVFNDNQGAAHFTASPSADSSQLTFFMRFKPQVTSGATRILWNNLFSEIRFANDELRVRFEDTSGSEVWDIQTTDANLVVGTEYYLHITIDLGTPSATITLDGVAPSFSSLTAINAGNGTIDMSNSLGVLAEEDGSNPTDIHVSDLYLEMGAIRPLTAFHDGSDPQDPGDIGGSPLIDISGETAAQLNAGTHGGSLSLTPSGTFVSA